MNRRAPPPPDPVMELCGSSPVTCLAFGDVVFAHKKSTFFSGHQNGKILCWNLTSQRVLTQLEAHSETVLWVINPKENILISQGREGLLKVWAADQSNWKLLCTVPTAAFIFCNSSLLSLAKHYMLSVPVEDSGIISVHCLLNDFTLDSEQIPQRLTPAPQREHGMCMKTCSFLLNDQSPRLLVAYEGGSLILWDILLCVALSKLKAHPESIMCLDICATKETGVFRATSGSVDTDLKSWLISEDTLTQDRTVSVTNPGLGSLAYRRDGRIVASGGWDGLCRMFTSAKLRPLVVLSHHKESVQCVAFSEENRLAAGSKDGYITMWDVYVNK
ncbi:hypothetical protein EGW08_004873 [Elysia chlorotica]|uniref:Uncharacterized protein n=1 Tax=Elysia chlorotica TaxID=188477 RepID=A0A433U0G1_ELYCH|nr:hypothetical protein EGW08_004873 [Elysia chlorotica]